MQLELPCVKHVGTTPVCVCECVRANGIYNTIHMFCWLSFSEIVQFLNTAFSPFIPVLFWTLFHFYVLIFLLLKAQNMSKMLLLPGKLKGKCSGSIFAIWL